MAHLTTGKVEDAFAAALHSYISHRAVIVKQRRAALTQVMDTSKLEAEQAELIVTIRVIRGLMGKEIDANTHTLQNQDG